MKLAFSTLGCPEWNLEQILAAARQSSYDGVEWRGYQAEMDLPKAPLFTPEAIGPKLSSRRICQEVESGGFALAFPFDNAQPVGVLGQIRHQF